MERRNFLKLAGMTAVQLAGCDSGSTTNDSSNGGPLFDAGQALRPLALPELLTGTVFNLTLQTGSLSFLDGKSTPTYGINGPFLGPALKVRKGDTLTLNVTNSLPEVATLHWHGMHVPGNMDGGPHQTIQPGTTWVATFTVNQGAGTNWFHPHTEGQTGRQVYMGLGGLMIVEDETSDMLDLPRTWGTDDIPLILQDRLFRSDGSFDYAPTMFTQMTGLVGDTLLCNGTAGAFIRLPAKHIRFRILNASNARVYDVALSDDRTFWQIATDTALLPEPVALQNLKLSPGERAEIVVDFTMDQGRSFAFRDRVSGADLVVTDIDRAPDTITPLPAQLVTLPVPDPAAAVRTRSFILSMGMGGMRGGAQRFLINGKAMDKSRIDQIVPLGELEIWEISNTMNLVHNFHVHGTHFYILDRNGSASHVAAYEKGYKDVVLLNPFDTVRILIRMTDYTTDAAAPYMFHCHILEHEDGGMMGQFTVVA